MFHCVSETLVGAIGADPDNTAFVETYQTLYRLPDHSQLEKKCKIALGHEFDLAIKRFAQLLITLKNKRHDADYDPLKKFALSEVRNDIAQTRTVLEAFSRVEGLQKARFAYFIVLDGKRAK